jgi:hypothetical protein
MSRDGFGGGALLDDLVGYGVDAMLPASPPAADNGKVRRSNAPPPNLTYGFASTSAAARATLETSMRAAPLPGTRAWEHAAPSGGEEEEAARAALADISGSPG